MASCADMPSWGNMSSCEDTPSCEHASSCGDTSFCYNMALGDDKLSCGDKPSCDDISLCVETDVVPSWGDIWSWHVRSGPMAFGLPRFHHVFFKIRSQAKLLGWPE